MMNTPGVHVLATLRKGFQFTPHNTWSGEATQPTGTKFPVSIVAIYNSADPHTYGSGLAADIELAFYLTREHIKLQGAYKPPPTLPLELKAQWWVKSPRVTYSAGGPRNSESSQKRHRRYGVSIPPKQNEPTGNAKGASVGKSTLWRTRMAQSETPAELELESITPIRHSTHPHPCRYRTPSRDVPQRNQPGGHARSSASRTPCEQSW